MFLPGMYQEAIRGDHSLLLRAVGPTAIFHVSTRLSGVFVVERIDDHWQGATLAFVSGSIAEIQSIFLPPSFRVTGIGEHGEAFVLTAADGRTVRGTLDQFMAAPKLFAPDDRSAYFEQLEQVFFDRHLLRPRPFGPRRRAPATDMALSDPAAVATAGEARVPVGDAEVWLDFDCAWPEKVLQLLPHARRLLAELARIGRAGAEFLWANDPYGDEATFFDAMTPTGLIIFLTGDFEIHYERTNGVLCFEGYWRTVTFTADGTPVDHWAEP